MYTVYNNRLMIIITKPFYTALRQSASKLNNLLLTIMQRKGTGTCDFTY